MLAARPGAIVSDQLSGKRREIIMEISGISVRVFRIVNPDSPMGCSPTSIGNQHMGIS
jgi:hypothetical protein